MFFPFYVSVSVTFFLSNPSVFGYNDPRSIYTLLLPWLFLLNLTPFEQMLFDASVMIIKEEKRCRQCSWG